MRLICFSDTHHLHRKILHSVPDGDVIICAGDCTNIGSIPDLVEFNIWFSDLPHKNKILIAGNHDFCFCDDFYKKILSDKITYLEDSYIKIDNLKFYGSPWTPIFGRWAFMLSDMHLKQRWENIPIDTDILITHGPPKNILDLSLDRKNCGDQYLLAAIKNIHPKIHIFGHIHEAYGKTETDNTKFYNVSICTRKYTPSNNFIIIDI